MNIEDKFPKSGKKTELKLLGARHLTSDEFLHEGRRAKIEYMVYERDSITVIWKKPINSDVYLIHHVAKIEKTYPVPVKI